MDSRFRLLLVVGLSISIYGTTQLLSGWYHADIARREATVVGTIQRVHHGKHDSYAYTYRVGELTIQDADEQCETALNSGPCEAGTPVLVYYDRSNPLRSLLNEYGAESQREFHLGRWMAPSGVILLFVFYLGRRNASGEEVEDEAEDATDEQDSGTLHIVPGDKN